MDRSHLWMLFGFGFIAFLALFVMPWIFELDRPPGGAAVPPAAVEAFGQSVADIIQRSDGVEIYRVDPLRDNPRLAGTKAISGYGVKATGADLDRDTVVQLRKAIFDEKNFGTPNSPDLASLEPIIAIRFSFDRHYADLLINFENDEYEILGQLSDGKDIPPIHRPLGAMRPELVKIVRAAFPKDILVQAITDEKPTGKGTRRKAG
jgi:hypothetical protein